LQIVGSTFSENFAYQGIGQNVFAASTTELFQMESCNLTSYHNSVYTSGKELEVKDCFF